MQFIDNSDKIVEVLDILGALMLRNLDVDVASPDKPQPMFQLIQFQIYTIEQSFHDDDANDRGQNNENDDWDQQLFDCLLDNADNLMLLGFWVGGNQVETDGGCCQLYGRYVVGILVLGGYVNILVQIVLVPAEYLRRQTLFCDIYGWILRGVVSWRISVVILYNYLRIGCRSGQYIIADDQGTIEAHSLDKQLIVHCVPSQNIQIYFDTGNQGKGSSCVSTAKRKKGDIVHIIVFYKREGYEWPVAVVKCSDGVGIVGVDSLSR